MPRLAKELVRWGIALVIFWFLGQRVINDWPAVRAAAGSMKFGWLIVAALPGALYVPFRIAAWKTILRELGVATSYRITAPVWTLGEIIRYVPGNIWSVVGRVAQFEKLKTTKTVVFFSMVIEAIILLLSATILSAVGLLFYSTEHDQPLKMYVLLAIVLTCILLATRRPLNRLVTVAKKIFRRFDGVGQVGSGLKPLLFMTLAWLAYAFFQLGITASLGAVPNGVAAIAMLGIFTASWLLGYLSFLTPSGLGVREAVLVFLLRPYVDQPTALLIALVTRLVMILLEVLTLGVVYGVTRRRTNDGTT